MKPAVLRPLAEQDLIDIVRWYAQEGGIRLGTRAFDAARQALETVERMPGLGSPGIGEACNLPGLRLGYHEVSDPVVLLRARRPA